MEKVRQIINQLKNSVSVEQLVFERKKECIEESKKILKGNSKQISLDGRKKTIGLNRVRNTRFGGIISASNDFIQEDRKVRIENGIADIIDILTGDLNEIYCELFEKLKTLDSTCIDVESISLIVHTIVNNYFGENGDVERRLEELLTEDEGTSDLSALKGKNLAACVERALLSQNLLKMAGVEVTIKQATIICNGNCEGHAYNIIRSDGKNYMYDASLPVIYENGNKSPIVGTISDEEYMLTIDGLAVHGCQTKRMRNGIIYDSSFGTVEQELSRYTPEELIAFRKNAGIFAVSTQNVSQIANDENEER